jgi:adenylate cyclase
MEAHGSAGKIQVTEDTKRKLGNAFQFEKRGTVEVRGKGEMELYYLMGRTG